jgi:hypothetical protein
MVNGVLNPDVRFTEPHPTFVRASRRMRHVVGRPSRAQIQKAGQFTSTHVWMAPALQEILLRVEQSSLAVMCPARWCSPAGLLALMGSANRGLITRTGSMSR